MCRACKGADGESIIPASVRADGSVRKQIRVRPGYVATEDVPRYRSPRAAQRRDAEQANGASGKREEYATSTKTSPAKAAEQATGLLYAKKKDSLGEKAGMPLEQSTGGGAKGPEQRIWKPQQKSAAKHKETPDARAHGKPEGAATARGLDPKLGRYVPPALRRREAGASDADIAEQLSKVRLK